MHDKNDEKNIENKVFIKKAFKIKDKIECVCTF